MKIEIKHFNGLRECAIEAKNGLTVVCGGNGTGKSSVIDAIRLALLGKTGRSPTKKQLADCITLNESSGYVQVDGVNVHLKNGRTTGNPAEQSCWSLCPEDFITAQPDERMRWVWRVSGGGLSQDHIKSALQGIDYALEVVAQSRTASAARTALDAEISNLRGAWKYITGEAYGSQKAETWRHLPSAPIDMAEINALEAKAEGVVREMELRNKLRNEISRKLSIASKAPSHDDIAALELVISGMAQQNGALKCPCCSSALELRDGELHKHPSSAGELSSLTKKLDEWRRARAFADNNPVSEDELASVSNELRALSESLMAMEETLYEYKQSNKNSTDKTQAAKDVHERIKAMLRAKQLIDDADRRAANEALDTVNLALANAASECGIPQYLAPALYSDMALYGGAFPYRALSKGEQWQIRLCIAIASRELEGRGVVAIDDFECVEPSRRAAIFQALASKPYPCILAGVLSAKPDFGADAQVVWLEREDGDQF